MKLPEYIFTIYIITDKNRDFPLKYPHPINQSVINKAFSLDENALLMIDCIPSVDWLVLAVEQHELWS